MTRLEQLRLDAGLSRRDLGERSGVNHETVRQLEEGIVSRPHVETLIKLAGCLDARPSELLLPAAPTPEEAAA